MKVRHALQARKSTRAFLDKPVDRKVIERLLEAARYAPSGANTQPWQVAVVSGETKQKLEARLEALFRSGEHGKMDYQYYPLDWFGPYKKRRLDCGLQLYSALGIQREDKPRRVDQWVANYRAFDAPVCLFFFLDAGLEAGSYVDYGMFLQSLMLAAVAEGLATCPQAALAEYPAIVKEMLGFAQDTVLICGMALGYEDKEAPVNTYRTPREDVHTFTRFFE
jgi:nitroreductase